ncbi:helix-turn-helix transcriptional regulator [Streptomyces sp. NPDC051219]|uniref:helix-turn-helix domain-containing protein n=1 Tax=Streptomyces sp. NPDC051219 TaxID=3155283 RepID=UPI00341A6619
MRGNERHPLGAGKMVGRCCLLPVDVTGRRAEEHGELKCEPHVQGEIMSDDEASSRTASANMDAASERVLRLTRREREVLLMLADGMPDKELARELGIASRTVRAHLANITRKLGVKSRLQAALVGDRQREVLLP